MSEAKECKFLAIVDEGYVCNSMTKARRITVQSSLGQYMLSKHFNPHLRSVVQFGRFEEYLRRDRRTFFTEYHKLLRVLDLEGVIIPLLPKAAGYLIHLRHLGLRGTNLQRFSFSINNLRNLRTLDIRSTKISRLPKDIWKMQNTRHLYLQKAAITGRLPVHIFPMNLKTLSTVSLYGNNWVSNFLGKLTNLKKLGIKGYFVSQADRLCGSIVKLSSLKNLKLSGTDPILDPTLEVLFCQPSISKLHLSGAMNKLPEPQRIQPNLTKLSLKTSQLVQDPFATLDRLPDLKMRRLLSNSFCGREMFCSTGGFLKLQFLEICELDTLEEWRVELGAFPCLGCLVIRRCEKLKVLPEGLQYVASLKELVLEGMPDEFEARIQKDIGDDWYKVKHISSIIVRM